MFSGRANLPNNFASDLQTWDGNDSLVVALYGAWGSGKNFGEKYGARGQTAESALRQLPVIEFNPWQLSGTGNIPSAFF